MQFIDEVKIYVKAGDGGNGCIGFRREKYVDMGGPNGGDGGRGGSVIIEGDASLNTLVDFRYKQHFKASNGENGKGSNMTGRSGNDMLIRVPLGTQIFTEDEILLCDITQNEQKVILLEGAKGGLGNSHFKSSINQAPRRKTLGAEGGEMWLHMKLKLLSDVGLVGLPNAGKSTFLSVSTAAKPKIADYPFTTLSPILGIAYVNDYEFVIADIPGLIEGASQGIGLGDQFLKHIERCRILIHIIDVSSDNIEHDYKVIRKELAEYTETLLKKPIVLCLNKIDLVDEDELNEKVNLLLKLMQAEGEENIVPLKLFNISTYTTQGVQNVLAYVASLVEQNAY